jgi:hypothetical protein
MTDSTLTHAAAALADRRIKARQLATAAGISLPTVYDYRSGYRPLDRAPYAVVLAWYALYTPAPLDPDRYAATYADTRAAMPATVWQWLTEDPARLHSCIAYCIDHKRGRPRKRV